MTKRSTFIIVATAFLLGIAAAPQQRAAMPPRVGIDWPAFRGIDATGVTTEGRPTPTTFSPASAVWRTKIPGLGNSSPIVWGDLLCVTTAISEKDNSFKPGLYGNIEPVNDSSPHEWKVICLDKRTGAARWEQTVYNGVPAVKRHPKSTQANATLATDGTHLVAFFGSSGKELWRVGRSDVPTWGTPAIVDAGGRTQVVVNGWKHTGGYDFETGRELWKLTGGGDIPTPTPIAGHGLIFITSAHGKDSPVHAIRATATGDVTLKDDATSNAGVAWSVPRAGSYMSTPLLYGDYLYVVRWNGILGAYDARTGTRAYQQRLGQGATAFTASPVASGGHIYFATEDGEVYVVKAGPTFELVATNKLDAAMLATPAISEGRLFIRTKDEILAF